MTDFKQLVSDKTWREILGDGLIRDDLCLTVREVGGMLGIGKSSIQRILSDRVCARWVPLLLHEDQMLFIKI